MQSSGQAEKNDRQNHEKSRCQFQSMNVIGHASIPVWETSAHA